GGLAHLLLPLEGPAALLAGVLLRRVRPRGGEVGVAGPADQRVLARGGEGEGGGVGREEPLPDQDLAQPGRLLARLADLRLGPEAFVQLRLLDQPLADEEAPQERVLEL